MKKFLLLLLVLVGLVAWLPTESKAQVVIAVRPAYSNGYYYQGQPYYRHYPYRHYHHYYRSHRWHHDD
jgi:hypothetical protein